MSKDSRILLIHKNKVSQPYKPLGNRHLAIDVIGDNGKPNNSGYLDSIIAHSCGTVVAVVNNVQGYKKNSYGNYVKIRHLNGMYTLYAHLKYGSIKVSVGMQVIQGKVIGYMGNTGYSFGAHLHFEVRDVNDKKIDPTPYINADLPRLNESTEISKENETNDVSDTELLLLVKKTIRGDFGSGFKRKNALGNRYSEVQNQVNLNYKNKTTRWDNIKLY